MTAAKDKAAKSAKGAAPEGDLPKIDWHKLSVKRVRLSKVTGYARNARTHSKKQVEAIAASMREFGIVQPILIDEGGVIIAGHGRVLAAEQLGLKAVPAITVEGLSEAQRKALRLADNRIAEQSSWDGKLLGLELRDLQVAEFDELVTGFSASDLERYTREPNKSDVDLPDEPDETPDPEDMPVAQAGDLWLLGDHRLLCGDACSQDQVARLLADGLDPVVMVTDPPYGVNYDADWRNQRLRADGTAIGGRSTGKVSNDDRASWTQAWRAAPCDIAYVWHAGLRAGAVFDSLVDADFEVRAQIIWRKPAIVIGRGHYHFQHEPAWYAVRKGKQAHWRGDRSQSTVWDITNRRPKRDAKPGEDTGTNHSTQKPVGCMAKPILHHTDEGEAVFDPFVGSGTTIVAAEQTKRVCYAIDIDPAYVDVAIKRWQNLTGKQAVLSADGRSFADVEKTRRAETEAA